jgi:epoxyqueuosine reductase
MGSGMICTKEVILAVVISLEKLEEAKEIARLDDIGATKGVVSAVAKEKVAQILAQYPEDLGYIKRRLEERFDIARILPDAKSVIVGVLSYLDETKGIEALDKNCGFVSRFAWGKDYHEVMMEKMEVVANILRQMGAKTKVYVDTGPVMEKVLAVQAGLGFMGKNTLFVHPVFGSFVFLGVIITDAIVEPATLQPLVSKCGGCALCMEACPTSALFEPFVLDPQRCIAHLTVSAKKPVPPELGKKLKGNLFGCDICQDVCPFNKNARRTRHRELKPRKGVYMPKLKQVLALTEKEYKTIFEDTPVLRRPLWLLKGTAALLEAEERENESDREQQ